MSMASEDDVRRIATALPGVSEHAHVDRQAFRARVIFATLGGGTVNLKLVPEQTAMLIEAEPDTFLPLGGWTRQGYVGVRLDRIDDTRLEMLLRDAWRNGAPRGARLPD
jgi:hypothetical protein